MKRLLPFAGVLVFALPIHAQDEPKKLPDKAIALIQQLGKSTPEELIAKFDKNADKELAQDELPPFLTKGFERADRDGNGKLNLEETRMMLEVFRRFSGPAPKTDEIATQMLQRLDQNKDGKIAKSEAQGRLAEGFAQADKNSDGFIDRSELQALAARFQAKAGGFPPNPGGPAGVDFDALDKDANGRISRQEAGNSPLARTFAEIDRDNDGQISRREFEAYTRKSAP